MFVRSQDAQAGGPTAANQTDTVLDLVCVIRELVPVSLTPEVSQGHTREIDDLQDALQATSKLQIRRVMRSNAPSTGPTNKEPLQLAV